MYAGASISGVVLAAPLGGALWEAAPSALWPVCAALLAVAACASLAAHRMPAATQPAPVPVAPAPQEV
jgi:hypothetical protein